MPTILFDQVGLPAGTIDRSRDDIVTGAVLTIKAGSVVGTAVFGLLDRPLGSTAVLAGAGLTRTMTPDVTGPYRARVIDDNDGSESIHTFNVVTIPLQLALPASNERANPAANDVENDAADILASETNKDGTFKGWHPGMTAAMLRIEEVIARSQGTGLLSGGLISIDTATTVDITAGTGQIADYTDPLNPIITPVAWAEQLAVTVIGVASNDVTLFAFDADGVLSQILLTALASLDRIDFVIPCVANHTAGVITSAVSKPVTLGYDGHSTQFNFLEDVIGPANVNGNVFSGNGVNLSVDCTGGAIFDVGSNFRVEPKLPDTSTTAPAVAPTVFVLFANATTGSDLHSSTAFLAPGVYQDAPGSTAVVSPNDWTIQRLFRSATDGTIVCGLGQETFNNKSDAVDALFTHSFAEYEPLPSLAFRSLLVVKGNATDLTNIAQAQFFEAPKFRVTGAGGAGAPGASSFLALQDTPNSYSGQALLMPRVNAAENELEFTNVVVSEFLNGVFVGDAAGNYPTLSGIDNTAVGDGSGAGLTTGFANSFFGHGSGIGAFGGAANTGIGDFALATAAGGSLNVGVGAGSGSGAFGSNGVYIGGLTGNDTTSGERQTLVGSDMQARLATQDDVIAIGSLAASNEGQLMVVDPGLNGTFMGASNPGNWPTLSGLKNSCYGENAGGSLTTGGSNTFMGVDSGKFTTSGISNAGFGQFSLGLLSGGGFNSAFGDNAGASLEGGSFNSFFGRKAGSVVLSGVSNLMAGAESGETTTSGSRNVVLGADLDARAATQDDLIAIGSASTSHAGQRMIVDPGLDGVFIGAGNPGNWPAATGLDNNVLGDNAAPNITTAFQLNILGNDTAATLVTGDNVLLWGHGVDVPAASTSDYLSIGDIIFGDLNLGGTRFGGSGAYSSPNVSIDGRNLEMVNGNIDMNLGTIFAVNEVSIEGTTDVRIQMRNTNASVPTDEERWRITANGSGGLNCSSRSNDGTMGADFMTVARDGIDIPQVSFPGDAVQIGSGAAVGVSVSLELSKTDRALLLNRMDSTAEGNLTAVNGMMIYNTTTNKFRGYENGAWADLI